MAKKGVKISLGTYNVFQQYWFGQWDPLYAVLSRRPSARSGRPSSAIETVMASKEERERLKDVAHEIIQANEDGMHVRVAKGFLNANKRKKRRNPSSSSGWHRTPQGEYRKGDYAVIKERVVSRGRLVQRWALYHFDPSGGSAARAWRLQAHHRTLAEAKAATGPIGGAPFLGPGRRRRRRNPSLLLLDDFQGETRTGRVSRNPSGSWKRVVDGYITYDRKSGLYATATRMAGREAYAGHRWKIRVHRSPGGGGFVYASHYNTLKEAKAMAKRIFRKRVEHSAADCDGLCPFHRTRRNPSWERRHILMPQQLETHGRAEIWLRPLKSPKGRPLKNAYLVVCGSRRVTARTKAEARKLARKLNRG